MATSCLGYTEVVSNILLRMIEFRLLKGIFIHDELPSSVISNIRLSYVYIHFLMYLPYSYTVYF